MKRDDVRRWMDQYLTTQQRLTIGSAAAMAAIGCLATLAEFAAVLIILRIGFFGSWILSGFVAVGLLAAVQAVTWFRMPGELGDSEHEVELSGGHATIRISPGLSIAWTYGFGSLDADQSKIELLINLLTIPQRMCCAAWFAWQRYQELQIVDAEACARIIHKLHRKSERVNVSELESELKLQNAAIAIRQAALIDGVVLLTRGELGMSLANRLTDALADWRTRNPPPEKPAEVVDSGAG